MTMTGLTSSPSWLATEYPWLAAELTREQFTHYGALPAPAAPAPRRGRRSRRARQRTGQLMITLGHWLAGSGDPVAAAS